MTQAELTGWTTIWNIKDADDFRQACAETSQAIEATEPGTVVYEWFMDDAGKTATIHEWFVGNDGAKAHMNGLAVSKFMPKLLEASELAELHAFGDFNEEMLAGLANWSPKGIHRRIGGFHRIGVTVTL